jgi:hypothetical protein
MHGQSEQSAAPAAAEQSVAARRAAELVRATCSRIRHLAPAGLGCWEPATERVHAADVAALTAIEALERHAGGDGFARVLADASAAMNELVAAWRSAALLWAGSGCPQ